MSLEYVRPYVKEGIKACPGYCGSGHHSRQTIARLYVAAASASTVVNGNLNWSAYRKQVAGIGRIAPPTIINLPAAPRSTQLVLIMDVGGPFDRHFALHDVDHYRSACRD